MWAASMRQWILNILKARTSSVASRLEKVFGKLTTTVEVWLQIEGHSLGGSCGASLKQE